MIREFRELYGAAEGVRVFRAPGRTNLIGEPNQTMAIFGNSASQFSAAPLIAFDQLIAFPPL